MYLADIFTVHANIAGIPAVSIPNGIDENGMSIGLQLMAPHGKDAELLALCASLA
jgi:aspartyl-tRNA(Asn)/glutamyl-tRNA(Gln) amidotransferase subunit A